MKLKLKGRALREGENVFIDSAKYVCIFFDKELVLLDEYSRTEIEYIKDNQIYNVERE